MFFSDAPCSETPYLQPVNQGIRHKLYTVLITELINSDGNPSSGVFRISVLVIAIFSALGSLYLTILAGLDTNSVLVLTLFIFWVLSPFIALSIFNIRYRHWPLLFRMILYSLMLVLSTGSLIAYSGMVSPAYLKPEFVFIAVPLFSWLLIGILFLIVRIQLRKKLNA